MLLKHTCPTPTNAESPRSCHRDTDMGYATVEPISVMRGSAARKRISLPMCDQSSACNRTGTNGTGSKGKVFYGQEPPSGESTTTESGVNYQLLSVMH